MEVLGETKSRKVTLRFLVWEGGTKIWNKFKRNFILRIGERTSYFLSCSGKI